MFEDARKLADDTTLECDLCIIGAGAAGISIALQFIDSSFNVCVLESGGLNYNGSTQDLYRGASSGLRYRLKKSRLRYFGGSTNHWTGNCSPYAAIDFEKRSWIPESGWPISLAEFTPYYHRAQTLCQLGSYLYQASDFWDNQANHAASQYLNTLVLQQSPPTRFGQIYREQLRTARNIRVFLHANLMNIETTSSRPTPVTRIQAGCLNGNRFAVKARVYILACGGIENARLLLASNQVEAQGLGNQYGHVGRYFMDNPRFRVGKLVTRGADIHPDIYQYSLRKNVSVHAYWRFHEHFQRLRQLANCDIYILPRRIWSFKKRPGRANQKIQETDIQKILTALKAETESHKQNQFSLKQKHTFDLAVHLAQLPNENSRVTLDPAAIDPLGMKRARIHWYLSADDKYLLSKNLRLLARTMGETEIGRIRLARWLNKSDSHWPQPIMVGNHHIGTTRMSQDASAGVVNKHCRMHAIDNLYVAGSSVFPTCSSANPTLTIIAMALRIADTVRNHLSNSKSI